MFSPFQHYYFGIAHIQSILCWYNSLKPERLKQLTSRRTTMAQCHCLHIAHWLRASALSTSLHIAHRLFLIDYSFTIFVIKISCRQMYADFFLFSCSQCRPVCRLSSGL
jgi:hypothetical protein